MKKIFVRYRIEIALCMFVLGILSLYYFVGGMFASNVDWFMQHCVFPDEFRKLFYKTGNFFPSFNANLGSGQNIYYMSYYGLFSPIYLFSYLFPSVSMIDYIIFTSIISIVVTILLVYRWLIMNKFGVVMSFAMAVMYVLAAPVIYHSYTQIMFVNYMPFLVMALIGVDIYFKKKKSAILVISTFLMIMTSFYFSIGGMLALTVYAVYRYLELEKLQIKKFISAGLGYALRIITAVLMSCVLLIPTLLAISARGAEESTTKKISIIELLIPQPNVGKFAYNEYGIGLSILVIMVLLAGLFYKKISERALAYSLVITIFFPLIGCVLNGGLYVRSKVYIPFIPILLYEIALYLTKLKDNQIKDFGYKVPAILTFIICVFNITHDLVGLKIALFFVEITVILIGCFFYKKKWWVNILLLTSISCLFVMNYCINTDKSKRITENEIAKVENENMTNIIKDLVKDNEYGYKVEYIEGKNDNNIFFNRIADSSQCITSLYSSAYNYDYVNFRKNIFGVEEPYRNNLMNSVSYNPIWQRMSGVKYIVSTKKQGSRKLLNSQNGYDIYENDAVAPIVYSTDRIISEEEYDKLEFPFNQLAYTQYAVGNTDNGDTSDIVLNKLSKDVEEIKFRLRKTQNGIAKINENNGKYTFKIKSRYKQSLELGTTVHSNNVLFLIFDVKNSIPKEDMYIEVNGIRNKLTSTGHFYYNNNKKFKYVMNLKDNTKKLKIVFGKGKYEISNIHMYIGKINNKVQKKLYDNKMKVTDFWKNGDRLGGTLDIKNSDRKVITTIPYDKGFTIKVDNKIIDYQKVNKGFVGFNVAKGKHNISISYKAPGLVLGQIISILGVVLMINIFIYEKYYNKMRNIDEKFISSITRGFF